MPNRTTHLFTFVAAGIVALAVAACGGGGGGGSSPVPTPTPTVTQTPFNGGVSAACAAPAVGNPANCVYTFQSNTAGLAVSVGGVSIGVTGATPLSTSPPFSITPLTVQFGTGANAYTVLLDQTASSASHTIYYNTLADTGSTSMSNAQSFARQSQSVMTETRRGIRSFSRTPAVATSGVYVRYDASKLNGRSIASIESNAGSPGGFDVLSSVAAIRGRVVRIPAGTDVATMTARLSQDAAVQGVYPLHYRVPLTVAALNPSDPYFKGTAIQKAIACGNFTALDCQWDMRQIHADYAWSYPSPGANAKIAVLDTGIDTTNPDISANLFFQATTAGTGGVVVQTTGNGQGVNTTYAAGQDTNGHGSNVAGIADADTNDTIGFSGVGYGAKLYVYRIFPASTAQSDQQSADTGDEAAAIADAVSKGVDVINLSIGAAQYDPGGGTGFDQAEHDAVEAAIAANVSVVAAAGNEGSATLDFPAAYDGVISVGATSLADGQTNATGKPGGTLASPIEYVSSYSNSGPGLAVVAPGGDPNGSNDADYFHWIFNDSTSTAALASDQCTAATSPDVCKSLFAGTSQATPHVTGAVALIQSALRTAHRTPLTSAQMLALLEGTADNISDPKMGHGRVNVLRAIESALGISPMTLPAPQSSAVQFVAFAYTNSGGVNAAPSIADVYYTHGAPVTSTGTGTGSFRIADIANTATSFKIGIWLDSNGDGKVDAGDQFGASTISCTGTGAGGCHIGAITVNTVPAGPFTLP